MNNNPDMLPQVRIKSTVYNIIYKNSTVSLESVCHKTDFNITPIKLIY